MNFHNVHLVFPLKIKKKTNTANNIATTATTVNNFFAHWIKEIDIKRLGDDTDDDHLTYLYGCTLTT